MKGLFIYNVFVNSTSNKFFLIEIVLVVSGCFILIGRVDRFNIQNESENLMFNEICDEGM